LVAGFSRNLTDLLIYTDLYGLNYTVLRYPNVYGPRQDPHGEAGVVAIFTGQMLADQQIVINGDGEQVRDFVFVTDCARANLLALTRANGSGIYNLGSGRGTSVNEIFAALRKIIGYGQEPIHGPAKVGETRQIYLDASEARRQFDWAPITRLNDGLAQTVAYFQSVEPSK